MQNYKKKNFIYTYKDFYRSYKNREKAEGKKAGEVIEWTTYRAVLEDFMYKIHEKIIKESFIFILPYRLGHIFLKGTRRTPENYPINWTETKKLGKVVRYLCMHSFGYCYHTAWHRYHVQFKNKTVYRFHWVWERNRRTRIADHIKAVSKDPNKRSLLKF